jgi:DNA-directed RNA polymerase specialized sigma24 family protein
MEANENTPPAPDPGTLGELVRRTRDGSQDAETTLHARYHAFVLEAISRSYLLPGGPKLSQIVGADDLAQEVWMRVFQAIRKGTTFASEGKFRGFLRAVTRNCFLQLYRNHMLCDRRSLRRQVRFNPAAHDRPTTGKTDPAESAADND